MTRSWNLLPIGLALLAAGCDRAQQSEPEGNQPVTIDVPRASAEQPGVTPMAERVAVIGLLNKRNGIVRDLTLRPGQAMRVKDVVVRLRACETTAPWEAQTLTGAFLQLDVRNPQDEYQRVFSGWVYKETPSLNVVEHPIYDVWPKSCAMTHPAAGASTVRVAPAASSRSKAPNSTPAPSATVVAPAPAATMPGAAADNATDNSPR